MANIEKYDSLETVVDVSGGNRTNRYLVYGSEDPLVIEGEIAGFLPAVSGGFPLHRYRYQHKGGGAWQVEANYRARETYANGDSTYTFNTTGATAHITQAKDTIDEQVPVGSNPADFKGAIGVNGDSVEGVDIVVPTFSFSEEHYFDDATMSTAYRLILFSGTGRVNNAAFKGLATGEVLFLGVEASKRGSDSWQVVFRFLGSPNAVNIIIDQIQIPSKLGHEYVWVRYADDVDNDQLIRKPIQANVERVYDDYDFSLLGIGV